MGAELHLRQTICPSNLETLSALLAICAGNSPVTGEFPAQRPVTRIFSVFFDLRPNKRLSEAGDLRRHNAHYDVRVMLNTSTNSTESHFIRVPAWMQYIYIYIWLG